MLSRKPGPVAWARPQNLVPLAISVAAYMRGALSILGRESECFSIAALCFLSMSMRTNIVPLQPVNERLRLLGGSAKVALDLLEYDSKLERAFITICGYATMPALCTVLAQPFQHTRDDLF